MDSTKVLVSTLRIRSATARYLVRSVKEGQGKSNIDTQESGLRQISVDEGLDGLAEVRDLVVVVCIMCYLCLHVGYSFACRLRTLGGDLDIDICRQ